MINLFIEATNKSLITLKKAASESDMLTIKRETHGIKGSAGNIGAHQMATLSSELGMAKDPNEIGDLINRLEKGFHKVIEILSPMRQVH